MAKELLSEFDHVSRDVADHLELRNVSGLTSYRQFEKRFEVLEEQRQEYLTNLKANFDGYRDKLNQVLARLTIDSRVREVFNPDDVENCYKRLFNQGVEVINEQAFARVLDEIRTQERELAYAQDVLRTLDGETARDLLERLASVRGTIENLQETVDTAWLRKVVETEDVAGAEVLGNAVKEGFTAISTAQATLRKATAPQAPDGEQAKHFYSLIPESKAVDFKELVLQMMPEVGDPAQTLEASLESLAELFRSNCVQVTVERRKR
jgi:hypothetical protein